MVSQNHRRTQCAPRMMFPKTHSEIDGLITFCTLLATGGAALDCWTRTHSTESFWPMVRAAHSRIKSNPCQNTWSRRSLSQKVFAHKAGNPGTVKFSFGAYRWPSAGVHINLAESVSSGVGVHPLGRRTHSAGPHLRGLEEPSCWWVA